MTNEPVKAKRWQWLCLFLFAVLLANLMWPNLEWFVVRCWLDARHWVETRILHDPT